MTPSLCVETSPDLPIVGLSVGFRMGSGLDPDGKAGLVRTMASLLRRGCGSMDALAFESAVESIGAEISEHVGVTAVLFRVDAIRQSLGAAVDLLVQMLTSPRFDPIEFEKLVRETQADLAAMQNSDGALVSRAFRRLLFDGHPAGRPVGGTVPSVGAIQHEDLLDVYSRIIVRENAEIAFSGDIDAATAQSIADTILGSLPSRSVEVPSFVDPVPLSGRKLVVVDKPKRTQCQLLMGCLATRPDDPDHDALLVSNTVFGGSFTSWLVREIRTKRGLAYGASSHLAINRYREGFWIWVNPDAAAVGETVGLVLTLLDRWRRVGISQRDLAFAKKYLIRSDAFSSDTPSKRASRALSVRIYGLSEDYYTGFARRVKQVTREEAIEAVRRRIQLDAIATAVTGTASEVLEPIRAAIPDLGGVQVLPPKFE